MTQRGSSEGEMFWTDEYQLLLAGQALNRVLRCKSVIADPLVRLQVMHAQKEVWRLYWKESSANAQVLSIWKSTPSLNNFNNRP